MHLFVLVSCTVLFSFCKCVTLFVAVFFFFQYYYCFVFHCEKVEIVHNFESVSRIQNIDMFFRQPE